jgi:hypothetical protein
MNVYCFEEPRGEYGLEGYIYIQRRIFSGAN